MLECFENWFTGAPGGAENNEVGFVCFCFLVWLKIAMKTHKIVGGCFVILSPGLWCFVLFLLFLSTRKDICVGVNYSENT